MVFLKSLNDSKSRELYSTLPSILVDLNDAVVHISSTLECCSLDCLDYSIDFQFYRSLFQAQYQSFGDITKRANYN